MIVYSRAVSEVLFVGVLALVCSQYADARVTPRESPVHVSLGGIGVREVAIAGLLAPFGIEPALAVAQSLSWEAVLVGSGLFAGLSVALLPGPGAKTDQGDQP